MRRRTRVPQRTILGGGGGGSQLPPLPASAVEYWHSEKGITLVGSEVSVWTGQLRAVALVPFNGSTARPTYVVDGTNFKGRSVVRSTRVGGRFMHSGTLGTPLALAGTKPHCYVIARQYSSDGNGQCCLMVSDVSPNHTNNFWMLDTVGSYKTEWSGGGAAVFNGAISTTVHRLQCLSRASDGKLSLRIDNSEYLGAITNVTIPSNYKAIQLGGGGGGGGDYLLAFALLCSAEMSAAELAALDSWASAYFGSP